MQQMKLPFTHRFKRRIKYERSQRPSPFRVSWYENKFASGREVSCSLEVASTLQFLYLFQLICTHLSVLHSPRY